ncbi:MAG: PQQ-binding-like beta-propeller repeat protein [Verrucomicrobiales bacterium]|nr:PQQ-binding-like beta-propeller repeat protein [Verrucomicrobiales bacterium]
MTLPPPSSDPPVPTALRLWPGLVLAAAIGFIKGLVPLFLPDAHAIGILGGFIAGLLVVGWWLFFSRAPWRERLGALAIFLLCLYAAYHTVHDSIASGMMGLLLIVHGFPIFAAGLATWAFAARHLRGAPRWISMLATALLLVAALSLVRTDGINGDGGSNLAWRWTQNHEQRLMGQSHPVSPENQPASQTAPTTSTVRIARSAALPSTESPNRSATRSSWPGFRGPARDGVVRGLRIERDWSRFPPTLLWRQPIGPAWSSFAVEGDLFYTQEQRGEEESVTCYQVRTGEIVWRQAEAARFWESNAGAGPRATPTLAQGRLYTFGGTGLLKALNPTNGTEYWTKNVAADAETKVPMWGFSSSPLVVGNLVLIAASGRLAAYDAATGERRWMAPARGGSYSSPQFAKFHDIDQVLFETSTGIASFAPATGELLWEHAWPGSTIIQPADLGANELIISTGGPSGGVGMRRLTLNHGTNGWSVEERWTSNGLKPYFNDFAIHQGHAYGFDGSILACINLDDGKRQWKDGRYGYGQLVLLPDQDLLLVLSERGQLVLVDARSAGFLEIARIEAITGKTWNHPALAGEVVLVRNSEEMAAFQLVAAKP